MNKKTPLYFQFWFIWIFSTLVYLALDFSGSDSFWFHLLGLFVPFGRYNGVLAFLSLGFIGVILLFTFILFTEKIYSKIGIRSLFLKVIINLVLLFLLTIITDVLIWGTWFSYGLLENGNHFIDMNFKF